MKELIAKEEFARATNLKNKRLIASALFRLARLKKVNRIYDRVHSEDPDAFVEEVLKELDVQIKFNEEELKNIPKSGPFILVSNHPFGVLEGLILRQLVKPVREDFRMLANLLLKQVEPLQDELFGVNPFEHEDASRQSPGGLRQAMEWLEAGNGVGIFPAGEVSSYQSDLRRVEDRAWNPGIIRMIKKAKVPIVPVYFHGSNSLLFHLLGIVDDRLRTLRLPRESTKKQKKEIEVRIGAAISNREQKEFTDNARFGRFVRAKVYSLGSALEVKKFFRPTLKFPGNPDEIVPATPTDLLEAEIAGLQDCFLLEQQNYQVFCAPSHRMPNLLNEIGRQREITFREVGEGTNKAIDLDEYDLYYNHLFIWEKEEKRVIGAYRIGRGDEIVEKYGRRGFYTRTLFRMKKAIKPMLSQAVELGRSFIIKDHQNKLLPLFLLWRGLLVFAVRNPNIRYFFGPVSISNAYSRVSKGLMVEFVRKYHWDMEVARHIKPKKKFRVKLKKVDQEALENYVAGDFKKMDRLIRDIEPTHFTMPILLKKYLRQNAKIVGFNIDPKFNNALDGLIFLDLNQVPADTIDNLRRDLQMNGEEADALMNAWLEKRQPVQELG